MGSATMPFVFLALTLTTTFRWAASQQNLPPQIVDHSASEVVMQNGASTVISCTIRYRGSYTVTFQRLEDRGEGVISVTPLTRGTVVFSPDHLDKYQIRHDDQSETWELTVNKLTEEDEGAYECSVQTVPPTRHQFTVKVKKPPIILNDQTSKDTSVKENDKMVLTCIAEGDPKPIITWTRDGDAPMPVGGQSWTGAVMKVTRVLREDRGRYVCEAKNSAGSVRRDINVDVQFAPSITTFRPVIVEHVENEYRRSQGYAEIGGSYAEIDCDVLASPRLQGDAVYWYVLDPRTQGRNRIIPKNDPDKYRIQTQSQANNEVLSKLTIFNFDDDDFRTYVCQAQNLDGTTQKSISLLNRRDADYVVINAGEEYWYNSATSCTPTQLTLATTLVFFTFMFFG